MIDYLRQNAYFLSAGVMLTFLSSFGQTYFISLFSGEIRATFGLSHSAWGGLYMLGTTCAAGLMVICGGVADRLRVRVLGVLVLVGLSLACLALGWLGKLGSTAVWALPVVIFALRFLGQGMATHTAQVAMARWFLATRGRALSIASLGFSAGEALVPMLIVAAMSMLSWSSIWMICAVLCLMAVPALARLLAQERTPQSLADQDCALGMKERHWRRMDALRHPLFWCMVPAILGPGAFNTALFFHQVHLAEIKGVSHLTFVTFFPIYTGVSIAMMMLSGWALDRFGTGRLIPFYQIPMIAAFAVFAYGQSLWALALGFVLLGLTSGANATLPSAFWAEFYGTGHIGAIKALATAVMVLGSAIGPGLTGLLIDLGVGLEVQFWAISGFFLISTLLMLAGVRHAMTLMPRYT